MKKDVEDSRAERSEPATGICAGATAGENLARLAFLHDADPAALAAAASFARWLAFNPDELVLDFGDVSNDVFLIAEGLVRVILRTPHGQEFILGDLGPGDVFGELAAIEGVPRSASVAALRSTLLCRMPAAAFLDLALSSRTVSLRLLQVLAARLRLQSERVAEMAMLPARLRLAAELLRLSRPRARGVGRVLSPPPAQHVLAARIGARRETVSLALTELQRKGLAEVSPRAIVLPQPEALRAAVNAQLQISVDEGADMRHPRSPA